MSVESEEMKKNIENKMIHLAFLTCLNPSFKTIMASKLAASIIFVSREINSVGKSSHYHRQMILGYELQELKDIIIKYNLNQTRLTELNLRNYSGSCSKDFTGSMLVIFHTERDKNDFYEQYHQKVRCFCCTRSKKKLLLNFPDHEKVYK